MKQNLSLVLLFGIVFIFLFQNQIFQKIAIAQQIRSSFKTHSPVQKKREARYQQQDLTTALRQLNKHSNDTLLLRGKYRIYKYRVATISRQIKEESHAVLAPYICNINLFTHSRFKIMDYALVIKNIDATQNFLFFFDFVIYDLATYYQQRLLAEIYVSNTGKRHLNFIRVSNDETRKEYPHILDMSVHGINTNNIVTREETDPVTTSVVVGLENTTLENSRLSVPMNNPFETNSSDRNPWILHAGVKDAMLSGEKAWPCGTVSSCWDKSGILINPPETKKCRGRNTSTSKRNVVASFNPENPVLPRDGLENGYLFDLAAGIPSFPSGISNK